MDAVLFQLRRNHFAPPRIKRVTEHKMDRAGILALSKGTNTQVYDTN